MFILFILHLRQQDVKVGISQWLLFLKSLKLGLIVHLEDVYGLGRSIFCTSEVQFDAYDVAFTRAFEGVELSQEWHDSFLEHLEEWLKKTIEEEFEALEEPDIPVDKLWEEFFKRLEEQEEEHNGGSKWIGTGGRSPFGHSGKASHGIRVGGGSRNRSAISVAGERKWASYRQDNSLDVRDFQVALKMLRKLAPEGAWEIDIDKSIRRTSDNGGEIELEFSRQRRNRVKLVLLLDSGGSMEPHAQLVEQLFTAASEMKGFSSFEAWHFHNTPYGWLFRDYDNYERIKIEELLTQWTPHHRVVWVGDACMAPYELLAPSWNSGRTGLSWIQDIQRHCPHSVWLNPEPQRYWNHQTIQAIGQIVDMYPLTLQGLKDGIKKLRGQPKQILS